MGREIMARMKEELVTHKGQLWQADEDEVY